MNKPLKFLAIGFGTIAILVALLVAYLSFAFDPNQFKAKITSTVLEKKQRTLTIDGDIKLRFFPKIGVELGKLSLSAKNSQENFAKLDGARVSLALLPLLSKKLVVDKVSLRGLNLHWRRDANGQSNIDDLTSQDSAENAEKTTPQASAEALQFEVEGIEVVDANIDVSDEKTKFFGALKNLQLSSGQIADKVPTQIHFSSHVTSQLDNKTVNDFQAEVNTGLRFDLTAQEFDLKKFGAVIDGLVQGNQLRMELKAPELQLKPKSVSVIASGLEAQLKTKLAQGDVDFKFTVPKLQIDESKASGDSMMASLQISGTQNVNAKLSTGAMSGTNKAFKLDGLQIEFERKQGTQNIKGTFRSALQGDLEAKIFTLPKFDVALRIQDPSLPQADIQLPLTGKLSLHLNEQSIQTELQSKFDESQLQAKVDVRGFSSPQIELNASVDTINLDRYMKPSVAPATNAGNAKAQPPAETPIDLSALKILRLNGKVSVGKLQVKNLKLTDLQLPLKASGGKLEMRGARARLYQGDLQSDVTVNANDNSYLIQQTLSNIQIEPLLKDAVNKDALEGRGSLKLHLQTQGKTSTELKHRLDGDIAVNLVDGAVKGINLAKSLRDFKTKILNKSDQDQTANNNEKTDFSAMSASIHFSDGIGKSDDLDMKSPFLRVGGNGTVNLRESMLDYVAKVTVVESAAGQGGADLAQLKNISIPVRIYGPFEKPAYKIQFAQIGSDVLKSAIKAKTAPIIEEKKKEVLDKLKGLFHR